MRTPHLCRQLLAAVLLAVALPAHAIATSTATALQNEAEGARPDQRALDREIETFRGSTISLNQAIAIAEALHAGSTTADISFDGAAVAPVYRVKTVHQDRIWQQAIDAGTGNLVGGEAAYPLRELDSEDRHNLTVLRVTRHRLSEAVRVAEFAASGRAISGGLAREDGRLKFVIVVVTGSEVKQVILEPPATAGRP